MIALTKKEEKKHNKKKLCHTCKKKLVLMIAIKKIIK